MTRLFSAVQCRRGLWPILALLPIALLLSACGGDGIGDAEQFYADLAQAIRSKDGGYMYDHLDSARRADIDTLIGIQMKNLDSLPLDERLRWDSLKGKGKREIYAKILEGDKGVDDLFRGEYKIVKVDTLVILTVQARDGESNLMYLRPSDGSFKITFPPRSPVPPVQAPPPMRAPVPPPGGGAPSQAPNAPGSGGGLR